MASMNVDARESVCGKCGYIVKGLATLTCPECGLARSM
jgi:rubrerythrin